MEKKVQKITLTSIPGTTFFLQITWDNDLGNGFNVALCDGLSAWTGKVLEEDISKEANDMEMNRQEYVDELKKALISSSPPTNKYNFDLVDDGESPDCSSFTYEKKLKDLSFKLGSTRLTKSENPAEIISELITHCLNCMADLYNQNDHLQRENERLRRDWKDMQEELERFVSAKEELEKGLYTKFTCVLNEKKAKIRSLKDKLDQTQHKVQQTSENSVPFDTVPVSQLKDEDYGGTTDEETNSQEGTRETVPAPAPALKRRPPSTLDDSPDIAPSRKRRQRVQKGYYTEGTSKKTETQEKQRCNPGPPKTSDSPSSSERPSLTTPKCTPDPDDLFSEV